MLRAWWCNYNDDQWECQRGESSSEITFSVFPFDCRFFHSHKPKLKQSQSVWRKTTFNLFYLHFLTCIRKPTRLDRSIQNGFCACFSLHCHRRKKESRDFGAKEWKCAMKSQNKAESSFCSLLTYVKRIRDGGREMERPQTAGGQWVASNWDTENQTHATKKEKLSAFLG